MNQIDLQQAQQMLGQFKGMLNPTQMQQASQVLSSQDSLDAFIQQIQPQINQFMPMLQGLMGGGNAAGNPIQMLMGMMNGGNAGGGMNPMSMLMNMMGNGGGGANPLAGIMKMFGGK